MRTSNQSIANRCTSSPMNRLFCNRIARVVFITPDSERELDRLQVEDKDLTTRQRRLQEFHIQNQINNTPVRRKLSQREADLIDITTEIENDSDDLS